MDTNIFYIGLLFSLFLLFIHRKHYQSWDTTAVEDKLLASVAVMVFVLTTILSLLSLFGAFD